jgi:cell division protein FtsX
MYIIITPMYIGAMMVYVQRDFRVAGLLIGTKGYETPVGFAG